MTFEGFLRAKYYRVKCDIDLKKTPDESYTENMKALYSFLVDEDKSRNDIIRATFIYDRPVQREIIESLLLIETDYNKINDIFQITPDILAAYKDLYYDTTNAFLNRLDRVSYVEDYPDKLGKELKLRTLNLGPDFVFYTYGNATLTPEAQRELVYKMFVSSSYKAMSMHFNSITSNISKTATEFAKIMMKAFETLEKYAPQSNNNQSELHQYLLSEIEEAVRESEKPGIDEEII